MKGSSSTRGATLVVVVLFTTLLLAVLLAASSQLTLSGRRSVGDQRASLQAQYVAESGVALARSRLRDVQTLLSAGNVQVKPGTGIGDLKLYAEKFCGNAVWSSTTDSGGTEHQTCKAVDTANADQFEVFALLVKDTAYDVLPAAEEQQAGSTLTSRRAFWRTQLGGTQNASGDGVTLSYRLRPTRVERVGAANYRFHLQFDTLNVGGEQASALRVLKASRTSRTDWWVDVNLPSYLDNVLFTNHHTVKPSSTASSWSPSVNFNDQVFDGPVHTNERFLFTPNATVTFKGTLSSAGCTDLPKVGMKSDSSCTRKPGFYATSLREPDNASATDAEKNSNLLAKLNSATDATLASVKNSDGTLSDKKDVTFTGSYRPMPLNANDQRAGAQGLAKDEDGNLTRGSGLYFNDDIQAVTLMAGDWSGGKVVPPSTYNAATKTWSPEARYQFIQVKDKNGLVTVYRAGEDRRLERWSGGSWTLALGDFNGVLFGEKNVAGLTGPGRDAQGRPLPALAPFSQITVAAQNDIEIAGDLVLSNVPCHPDEAADLACRTQKTETPKNVLGIYTQKGDVVITKAAPNNLNLHAMLMSSEGEVRVDDFDSGSPRGNVNLLGGLVENWYGAFGQFNSTTRVQTTGYGRTFSHDRRFLDPGFTPPFFPISPTWVTKDASVENKALFDFVVQQGDKGDLR
ncbi:pilus assembly PilX N-terminal domain-containing protein [Deinococcus aestuarii]|uniref:pilus assembly PilX N-terminal domain-containing protein n=1 Tax=Deinococcus aestuarii TaxID=2774531 RepID=UPI001C0D1F73|nr:pilus assembly PilX N-terminal domain-containing protein [Deinococcus aestuarii]